MPIYKDHSFRSGASAAAGADSVYEISQSIRFNDNDTTYMSRTPSSASNRKTWTWSAWCKRGHITDSDNGNMFCTYGGGSAFSGIRWETTTQNDTLFIFDFNGSSFGYQLHTTQVFRDPSAWYHIVFAFDSTESVSSQRARLYINGQRVTDFRTESYPTLNYDSYTNNNQLTVIGASNSGSYNEHLDGYLAEIHFLDGYAYGPEYFGTTNSSGIWIPIDYDTETGNYGTNGFKIDGSDSATLGKNVASGNTYASYTSSGLAAHDQVLDTPNNNFAVINSIYSTRTTSGAGSTHTVENGNLFQQADSYSTSNYGTRPFTVQPLNRGKWYFECEPNIEAGSGNILALVVTEESNFYANPGAQNTDRYGMLASLYDGTLYFAYGSSSRQETNSPIPAHGDIIGTAIDFDNAKIYFFVNGTEIHGQTIASGTAATNLSGWSTSNNWIINFYTSTASNNSNRGNVLFNFGQEGTFAGTQTAGGNSDSNGMGNFKHSVPSGYLALCTRNLFTG